MKEAASELLGRLLEAGASPIVALKESAERIFFLYLLGALVLSALIWWTKLRGRISFFRFMLPAKIWLHPSALFDLRFMVGRAVIEALVLVPVVVSSAKGATWLFFLLRDAHQFEWATPPWLAIPLVSCAALLGDDFSRFALHRLAHQIPVLWELHKVHHSAEVLTPLTVYRTHPFEGLLMRVGAALGLTIAAGCTAWLLGAQLSVWEVLGVHGLGVVWNLLGSNLRHSHVWIQYPAWLEHILISPAQHQIHHSKSQLHVDKNFGSVFAFWDFAGGSLYIPLGRETLTFGLPVAEINHTETILSALCSPVRAACFRLFRLENARPSTE